MHQKSIKKLLGNRFLAQRVNPPTTRGGIYLPEIVRDDLNTGGPKEWLVLAVGPGTRCKGRMLPIEFGPGDRVICHSYTQGPVPMDDGSAVLTADQVLCVIPHGNQNAT
jgi:co-chaperonin GroES (HSP10)